MLSIETFLIKLWYPCGIKIGLSLLCARLPSFSKIQNPKWRGMQVQGLGSSQENMQVKMDKAADNH